MADEVIRRSGSAADHGSFTGASGEWTHDTTLKAIRVHDGSQAGGYPIFHEGYVESAPDGGTDAYSADARRPVSAGETVRVDITSPNETTTPTFENTQGTPSGALTITTKDGSALWEGALSGVHELQLASGGGSWLVLDPNPSSQVDPIAYADAGDPTLGTLVDATNGGSNDLSEIDFTSGLSGAKRITVMFSDISLDGANDTLVQIGDSGGIESSGYTSGSTTIASGGTGVTTSSSGFVVRSNNASDVLNGQIVLTLMDADSNLWTCSHVLSRTSDGALVSGGGNKALSAALDRIRIVSASGNSFDGGSINILVE